MPQKSYSPSPSALSRLATLLCTVAVGASGPALAQSSAYCDRAEAHARSEASVLFAPRLSVQGLRNPSAFDAGPVLAQRIQLRVGASLSLSDAWRGARVLRAARADCAVHSAATPLRRALTAPGDALLVDGYRAQLRALEARHDERERLLARSAERLRQNLITVMEYADHRKLYDELRRRSEGANAALDRLHQEGIERPPEALEALVSRYEQASSLEDARASEVRNLEPLTVRVTGGFIPSSSTAGDWYGWLELSYNLGGFARLGHERDARRARARERADDTLELAGRVEGLRRTLAARVREASVELRTSTDQLAFIASTLGSLGASDLPAIAHARDGLALQQMLAESEHAFNTAIVESLSKLGSEDHAL